jgi:hypothetical protein
MVKIGGSFFLAFFGRVSDVCAVDRGAGAMSGTSMCFQRIEGRGRGLEREGYIAIATPV